LSEVDDDSESVDDAASAAKSVSVITDPAASSATAGSRFKEGTHYQRLATTQPTTAVPGHIEVAEVFWYGCSHCYALDPLLESWRTRQKPAYVDFVRIPAMWNETLKAHARLFYTAQVLGKLDELHTAMFRAVQLEGNPLTTEEKAAFFFHAHGVSDNDFHQSYNSASVQTLLNQADQLNRRYRIQSVPMLIVNGRYLTDIGMAGGQEQLMALVNELAAREHGR
jgi:thiol:disulfide interchange protein DsbA